MANSDLIEAARQLFPGGVNSPVRSFKSVGGNPIPIARASGPHVFDADGKRYIDYIGAFGPLILGHAHPAVVAAISESAAMGTAFGATGPGEVALGRRILQATDLDRIRFVNSGTEATMTAIRIARAATDRPLVVKFEGGYHGHSDGLLARAGSGVATLAVSDSAGVPEPIASQTAVLPLNDVAALDAWFANQAGNTAAVIVESIPANMGVVPLSGEFIEALQRHTKAAGAVLIADEVITGFRLRYGLSNLLPGAGLVCLGKIIGGGLPVGAVAGLARYMDLLAPVGPVYQAGTLSGNPLVMAAGSAVLDILADGSPYQRIDGLAAHLENALVAAARRASVPATVARAGSMLTLFMNQERPTSFAGAAASDTALFGRFHRALLDRGVMVPPSQFEAWFVSAAHDESTIDATAHAAHEALREAVEAGA
jgi:glutamate-1-semialdehyde 2,1-aminomutase